LNRIHDLRRIKAKQLFKIEVEFFKAKDIQLKLGEITTSIDVLASLRQILAILRPTSQYLLRWDLSLCCPGSRDSVRAETDVLIVAQK